MKSNHELIDLRSDTATLPTEEMLEAIKQARLGDDAYGEDPTVNKLQNMAAVMLGKEDALFVTSGTQANLISLLTNTKFGDRVILEAGSHICCYEKEGLLTFARLAPWLIKGNLGALHPRDIETILERRDIQRQRTTLVCIENTHNRSGGTIVSPAETKAIGEVTHNYGLGLYMDGARIFNAAVAMGIDVRAFTEHVDNLMFCLSKGLSCPVGSIIAGSQEFINRARKMRKILGGEMRQAGIVAAPGIIALEKMVDRLKEDHANARLLAEKLNRIDGIAVDMRRVQTNIVLANVSSLGVDSGQFVSELKEMNMLVIAVDAHSVRMVTHRGIEKDHIEKALSIIESLKVVKTSKQPRTTSYHRRTPLRFTRRAPFLDFSIRRSQPRLSFRLKGNLIP